jgi:hypothetical protein
MSSYGSPAAQGSAQATGAYAVGIAAQAGGTNIDGHATDSSGNVIVDFVWGGSMPITPNDGRVVSPTFNATGGTAGSTVAGVVGVGADYGWGTTTDIASAELTLTDITKTLNNGITRVVPADNHARVETGYAGYPAFTSTHQAAFIITQASGDGSTQTYTAPNNFLKVGDTINITGTGLDGTNLTVASANRYTFTVSASGTGSYINISGKARYTDELTANDGAYVGATPYVLVPSVLGFTIANATTVLNDAELTPTTASAVTPAIATVARTGTLVTITTAAAHGYAAGDSATIAAVTNTAVNGTFTLVSASASTLTYNTVSSGTIASGADTGTVKVAARAGTIKTQSIAAGAASTAIGAAITITPYFAS